jgi:hypothetical protein
MLRHLAPDAEMQFPNASYRGLEEIRAAYAADAPDDQVVPLGVQDDVVAFAWAKGGGTGRMLFEIERGLVTRLTVAFDER